LSIVESTREHADQYDREVSIEVGSFAR
jgi:hypothetical protein